MSTRTQRNQAESGMTRTAPRLRHTVREAVGTFDDGDDLQAAIDELRLHGFARHEISVLASMSAVEAKMGHRYRRVEELADNPKTPRTIFVSKTSIGTVEGALVGLPAYVAATAASVVVVASEGTMLATIITALSVGTGAALLGGVLAAMVAGHHAKYLREQIERGGLLLWVNVHDAKHEEKAVEVLKKNTAHDVHVHDIRMGG